jgi:hypothetical protein
VASLERDNFEVFYLTVSEHLKSDLIKRGVASLERDNFEVFYLTVSEHLKSDLL